MSAHLAIRGKYTIVRTVGCGVDFPFHTYSPEGRLIDRSVTQWGARYVVWRDRRRRRRNPEGPRVVWQGDP